MPEGTKPRKISKRMIVRYQYPRVMATEGKDTFRRGFGKVAIIGTGHLDLPVFKMYPCFLHSSVCMVQGCI